jgi:hypothetical protein
MPAKGSGAAARLSGRWIRPITVTSPAGAGGMAGVSDALPDDGASQPRSTMTAVPSASTSGVSTSKPTLLLRVRTRATSSWLGS